MLTFSAYGSMAIALASLAVILLVLRDVRGRVSLRVLMILVAFAALGLWAVHVLIHLPLNEL